MPNHFHLLLRQISDRGLPSFISDLENSYTKYINTRYARTGPILQGPFKFVPVETDEQFLHLTRYIHLNHTSAGLIDSFSALASLPYTSLPSYISNQQSDTLDTRLLLELSGGSEKYRQFVENYTDYQRRLALIKHLLFD